MFHENQRDHAIHSTSFQGPLEEHELEEYPTEEQQRSDIQLPQLDVPCGTHLLQGIEQEIFSGSGKESAETSHHSRNTAVKSTNEIALNDDIILRRNNASSRSLNNDYPRLSRTIPLNIETNRETNYSDFNPSESDKVLNTSIAKVGIENNESINSSFLKIKNRHCRVNSSLDDLKDITETELKKSNISGDKKITLGMILIIFYWIPDRQAFSHTVCLLI